LLTTKGGLEVCVSSAADKEFKFQYGENEFRISEKTFGYEEYATEGEYKRVADG